MKQLLLTIMMSVMITFLTAQNKDYIGIAAYNTQNAMPFGKLLGMFKEQFHPGIEATYGRNISQKKSHDWFLELRLSYFFHRYVQHGIPVYLNFGYRYKFNSKFFAETSIGAGYMHSIPATTKLKLSEEGDYENNKGIGRAQIMATYSLGLGYLLQSKSARSLTAFVTYQQRVQTPFINSYVPILPYTCFMAGIRKPFERPTKKTKQ